MGRYARLLEGAEAIEIKATIPQKQVRTAMARYGLTRKNDEQRYIYFFDTPRLDLVGRMHGRGWYARTTDRIEVPRMSEAEWAARKAAR